MLQIKIGITFICRFHRRPIQLLVFVPVGISSILHLRKVNCPGRETEETSTPYKTCWKCKNDKRPTETITSIWMGRRWNLKIKVITILILTEIFPSVHETYLETLKMFQMHFVGIDKAGPGEPCGWKPLSNFTLRNVYLLDNLGRSSHTYTGSTRIARPTFLFHTGAGQAEWHTGQQTCIFTPNNCSYQNNW